MKGQLSYLLQPMTLVGIVVLLLFLYVSISNFQEREKMAQTSLNLVSDATNILLVLANSEDCLAFKTQDAKGLYANIVEVSKLNEFANKFPSIEPDCARSFDFGWRVKVTEFKQSNNKTMTGRVWEFGAKDFSRDQNRDLRNSINFSIPISIRESEKIIRPGSMDIYLVDGELEKISGTFDWNCALFSAGKISSSKIAFHTIYSLKYDSSIHSLCTQSKTTNCRETKCEIAMKNLDSGGDYLVTVTYKDGKMVVK